LMGDTGLPGGHAANQIAVWAMTHTATLNRSTPALALQHVIIHAASRADTFSVPDPAQHPFMAYQKTGPHPAADAAGDPEEYLNANDDRMNWVTLANGTLWTSVNTELPATKPGASGHA